MELEAALRPARDVSGDFDDCFLLTSGEVILVVGDVCDKGVGSAPFMALFRSLIRASADPVGGGAIQMIGGRPTMVMQALQSASPADMLTRVAGFTNDISRGCTGGRTCSRQCSSHRSNLIPASSSI